MLFFIRPYLSQAYNLIKSASLFHLSIVYNQLKYGKAFNITPILAPSSTVSIERDNQGNITTITDGKKTPLILGSIPHKGRHIAYLKTLFDLSEQESIGIFSLNRRFERNWAGLSALVRNNPTLKLFTYSTTDFTVPSLEKVKRIVHDLGNRDSLGIALAYVHCKAGRSRSAFCIAAYLLYMCHKAGQVVTVDEIIGYLKKLRPSIYLGNNHKRALIHFCDYFNKSHG